MSTQIKACFNGCSYTTGEGFSMDSRDTYVYDRLVASRFNFQRENIAVRGSSNYTIFMRSAQAIISKKFDIVFTQWSGLNRLWFSPGPEVFYSINNKFAEFRYRNFYLDKKDKKKFDETALILNHDYQNIIELIDYCSILDQLGSACQTKTIYINGLVPWTKEISEETINDFDQQLSPYTKNILDFENRYDHEIDRFLRKLQEKFSTLKINNWVNIFDSFQKNTVDLGPERHHPGIESNKWMADKITTYLERF